MTLFLYNMDDLKHVQWESDRVAHDILSDFRKMNLTLLASCVEQLTAYDMNVPNPTKNIQYNNFLISGAWPGSDSHVSVDATAVMMARKGGEYPIPPEVMEYIKQARDEDRVPDRNLPNSEDRFERGVEILQAFLDEGVPYYSAVTMTGATWVECGWNTNVVNTSERDGKGQGGTEGWTNAGEGLFGITFWSTKKKIIQKLHSLGKGINVSDDESTYRKPSATHLMNLSDADWITIAKIYLDICAKKHAEILMNEDTPANDEDRTKILSAGYLWKAAPGREATFENTKTTADIYIREHERQGAIRAKNGFALQIWTSIFLDQYYNGLIDVDKIGEYDGMMEDYFNGGYTGNSSSGNHSRHESGAPGGIQRPAGAVALDPGDFKRNPKGFNIQKACEWINSNAFASSTHKCARWVRKAIEAGGISTDNRPTWTYKYIKYLPTIGFKFLRKATRKDLGTSYHPQPGDIAVYTQNGNTNKPGHICMWTGKEWVSDFHQKSMIVYGTTPEAYIFRFA